MAEDVDGALAHFVDTIRPLRRDGVPHLEIGARCTPPVTPGYACEVWRTYATDDDLAACEASQRRDRRERVLTAIHDWGDLFGDAPSAADWNSALRKRTATRVERYESTGRDWPSASTVQKLFGSWNEAITAAGFAPRVFCGRPARPGEVARRWEGHRPPRPRRQCVVCGKPDSLRNGRCNACDAYYRKHGGDRSPEEAAFSRSMKGRVAPDSRVGVIRMLRSLAADALELDGGEDLAARALAFAEQMSPSSSAGQEAQAAP